MNGVPVHKHIELMHAGLIFPLSIYYPISFVSFISTALFYPRALSLINGVNPVAVVISSKGVYQH